MKKTIIWLSIILVIASGIYIYMTQEPVLVFDLLDNSNTSQKVVKKFRAQNSLHASASGQFSAEQLKRLLDFIPANNSDTWIIDLRQESHGFINGIPVSWYKNRNSGNIDQTCNEIFARENKLLSALRKKDNVTIYTIKKLPDGDVTGETPVVTAISTVQSEEQLVNSLGANYQRFYVLDHHHPCDQEVDNFVKFIKSSVRTDTWLHFHCRGGKGRSSTFMAMYDIVLNAHRFSFEPLMKRQAVMGNIELSKIPAHPDKQWKADPAKQRYMFLEQFYAYVTDPQGYSVASWTDWLRANSTKN